MLYISIEIGVTSLIVLFILGLGIDECLKRLKDIEKKLENYDRNKR